MIALQYRILDINMNLVIRMCHNLSDVNTQLVHSFETNTRICQLENSDVHQCHA